MKRYNGPVSSGVCTLFQKIIWFILVSLIAIGIAMCSNTTVTANANANEFFQRIDAQEWIELKTQVNDLEERVNLMGDSLATAIQLIDEMEMRK